MTVLNAKTRALLWRDPVPREVCLRHLTTELISSRSAL